MKTRFNELLNDWSKLATSESGQSTPQNYIRLDKRKNEYGEFTVKVYADGAYDDDASYFTDDWKDAVGTFKEMASNLGYEITKCDARTCLAVQN